jgi:hypothetical protein
MELWLHLAMITIMLINVQLQCQATMSTMNVTIWNRAILVALLIEKVLALYGTHKFISVSTTANHKLLLRHINLRYPTLLLSDAF